jgi:hypothetical protein
VRVFLHASDKTLNNYGGNNVSKNDNK